MQTIELRQGYKIACLEEIALLNDWITSEDILKAASEMSKNSYGRYLADIVESTR